MDARTRAISETLKTNIHASSMLEVMSREGKTSGMGYTVNHVQPGRGFSSHEYSSKEMPNGRHVLLTTFYPGPFDALAGYSAEITERHSVWVGWEKYQEDESKLLGEPPTPLPHGAKEWYSTAFDSDVNWYADFGDDSEKAEAFAASLPAHKDGDYIQPFSPK